MKRSFVAWCICVFIFVFVVSVSDSAFCQSHLETTQLSKEVISCSEDLSFNLVNRKNVIPQLQFNVSYSSLSKTLVGNTAKKDIQTKDETGPGTGPDTAPQILPGTYYMDALTDTGAQHWFYTQADRNGQMTIHLDVPSSTTVDYDLYVYSYEVSSGNLYSFETSMNNPTVAEHISFSIASGSYYFICVNSYQGGGSNMYYYLHVETSALGVGEIDDFPDDARTVYPSLNTMCNATGELSMRNDIDFLKFTAVGNGAAIVLISNNANIVADIYKLNGSNFNYLYTIQAVPTGTKASENIPYPYCLVTTNGATHYVRIRHYNNKIFNSSDDNYTLKVKSFNCSSSLSNATILGRNITNNEIIYTAGNKLYINSQSVVDVPNGLEPLCVYHFEEPDTTFREALHDSHASSAVASIKHVSYNVWGSGMGVSSMSNALAIYFYRNSTSTTDTSGVYFRNEKTTTNGRVSQLGYTSGAFILDITDGEVKDFASTGGNGFYNGFFGENATFEIDEK